MSSQAVTFKLGAENDTAQRAIAAPKVTPHRGSRFLRYFLIGLDTAALLIGWIVATVLVSAHDRPVFWSLFMAAALVVVGIVLFSALGLYRARVCNLRTVEYARLARACLVLALLAFALAGLSESAAKPAATVLGASLTFVLAVVFRSGYRTWLTDCRRAGRYLRSVLLVGTGDEAAEIAALLRAHPELGYRMLGVVGDAHGAEVNGLSGLWRGELDDARVVLAETQATGAIVCASGLRSVQLNLMVAELLNAGVHLQLSSGLRSVDIGRLRPSPLAGEALFYVEPMTLATWQLTTKRAIDLALSSILLVFTAPVFAIAALGVKLGDRGPVLFKQRRVGREGETFLLYKLRTMRQGAEAEAAGLRESNVREGPLLKLSQDPRVTKFGRVLRATSIDELPQLWNVLNGTMSLVGPRPALPDEVASFDEELRAREAVRPGITGLWQVEGRDNPSFAAYRRFDLFYLHNWCVTLDLMILLVTVESVVGRVFRGLRHLDEDIPLIPPDVQEPSRFGSASMGCDDPERRGLTVRFAEKTATGVR